jgi:hypothetical protein
VDDVRWIGKTTLLDVLVERACEDALVLRACGAESEVELAFSALTDLLHPVVSEPHRTIVS